MNRIRDGTCSTRTLKQSGFEGNVSDTLFYRKLKIQILYINREDKVNFRKEEEE